MSHSPPLLSRTVGRRRALQFGAIGALGLTAGCTSANGPVALPEAAERGRPSPGGTLRIARPANSRAEGLHPAASLSAYEYLGALYNRLVKLDEAGTPVPDLAQDWDVSDDAMRWTFRMRDGVQFHDGRRFTSRDAAYTIAQILDPDLASPQLGVLSPVMSAGGLRASDPTTLVIELDAPHSDLPSLLSAYQCYVIPEDSGADIARSGVGTGPFRLDSFRPGGRGRVLAYEDHFAGRPTLDEIEFYSVQDTQARTNALIAGQVDLLSQTNLDFASAQVVAASSKATIARVKNGQWYTIPLLATSEEFSDVRVRQAIKLAYDPARILAVAAQGQGTVGNDNPVPPTDATYLDLPHERDPERAAALLAEVGRPDFRFEISTSSLDPVFTPMAVAFVNSLREAGIRASVRNESADSYYTEVWMQKPAMATYWFTGRPVDQLLNQIFRSGSSYNESAWSNETFDSVLDAARAEVDPERRKQHYQDAQRLIVEEGATLTPMFADRLVGISRDVLNYHEYGFEFDYINIGLR
ncbi:ABC transporter substrate-binding protein [Tessaracoccus oleiagri]|uniref:Peptide/nickel transport system substrate-binding protein n=1 Tax=Tessaracoccus oleiagri TaxID=686624 RepID=A0A1G9IBQ7_9ACTN|nr:ABC transporter substrate-binding protein [Tessaracoccus oleiagri]SDL22556.1 peptide/nickel transport system substrate-binding protein [Tessaracoccus oleiagri]